MFIFDKKFLLYIFSTLWWGFFPEGWPTFTRLTVVFLGPTETCLLEVLLVIIDPYLPGFCN